jgi:hypothetical protein
MFKAEAEATLLKRLGTPEEVAETVSKDTELRECGTAPDLSCEQLVSLPDEGNVCDGPDPLRRGGLVPCIVKTMMRQNQISWPWWASYTHRTLPSSRV